MPRKLLQFNSETDNIKITATHIKSADDVSLNIESVNNINITSSNINLTPSDLSLNVPLKVPAITVSGESLEDFIINVAGNVNIAVENSGNILQTDISNVPNIWITPANYNKDISLSSFNSSVKIEFKVNYIASPEANQFISFRVTRGSNPDISIVFQDCSLGTDVGATLRSIYYGNFIDTLVPESNPVTYTLHYKLHCPPGDNIDTSFGILGGVNNRNYIYLHELYKA